MRVLLHKIGVSLALALVFALARVSASPSPAAEANYLPSHVRSAQSKVARLIDALGNVRYRCVVEDTRFARSVFTPTTRPLTVRGRHEGQRLEVSGITALDPPLRLVAEQDIVVSGSNAVRTNQPSPFDLDLEHYPFATNAIDWIVDGERGSFNRDTRQAVVYPVEDSARHLRDLQGLRSALRRTFEPDWPAANGLDRRAVEPPSGSTANVQVVRLGVPFLKLPFADLWTFETLQSSRYKKRGGPLILSRLIRHSAADNWLPTVVGTYLRDEPESIVTIVWRDQHSALPTPVEVCQSSFLSTPPSMRGTRILHVTRKMTIRDGFNFNVGVVQRPTLPTDAKIESMTALPQARDGIGSASVVGSGQLAAGRSLLVWIATFIVVSILALGIWRKLRETSSRDTIDRG